LIFASSALVTWMLCGDVSDDVVVLVSADEVEFSRLDVVSFVVVGASGATLALGASAFTLALEGVFEEAVDAGVTRGFESRASWWEEDVTEGVTPSVGEPLAPLDCGLCV
jgi:hypothetical protein